MSDDYQPYMSGADQNVNKCWADKQPGSKHVSTCDSTDIVGPLGLCEQHDAEIRTG